MFETEDVRYVENRKQTLRYVDIDDLASAIRRAKAAMSISLDNTERVYDAYDCDPDTRIYLLKETADHLRESMLDLGWYYRVLQKQIKENHEKLKEGFEGFRPKDDDDSLGHGFGCGDL